LIRAAASTAPFDSFVKRMRRTALYLFTMIAAFSLGVIAHAIKTKQPQFSAEMREAEEYAVYSALINSFHPKNDGKLLLIQNRTESFYPHDGTGDETKYIKDHLPPDTSEETLNDYKSVDRQTKALDRRFVVNDTYLLVTEDRRHQWFTSLKSIQEFHQRYPNSTGIRLLSRVGFNKTLDEALVYSWGYCGGDCGGGGYYLLRKENGRWTIKQQRTWIS
jgi:hypothetical protein